MTKVIIMSTNVNTGDITSLHLEEATKPTTIKSTPKVWYRINLEASPCILLSCTGTRKNPPQGTEIR